MCVCVIAQWFWHSSHVSFESAISRWSRSRPRKPLTARPCSCITRRVSSATPYAPITWQYGETTISTPSSRSNAATSAGLRAVAPWKKILSRLRYRLPTTLFR